MSERIRERLRGNAAEWQKISGNFLVEEVWPGSIFLSVFYFTILFYLLLFCLVVCVCLCMYYVLSVEFFYFLPSPEERRGEIRHALHTCYSHPKCPMCHDSLRRMCHECVYISLFKPPCRKYAHVAAFGHF